LLLDEQEAFVPARGKTVELRLRLYVNAAQASVGHERAIADRKRPEA
jgi:hypothetical protein